jgi:hypothetical protein
MPVLRGTLAAALLLVASTSSLGADSNHSFLQVSGPGTTAVFHSEDLSRDIVSDVWIGAFGSARAQYAPGAPQQTTPALGITIIRHRHSSGELMVDVAGFTDDLVFRLDPNGRSAEVVTQVVVKDFQGTPYEVPVDVTWTATGPESLFNSSEVTKSPGGVNMERIQGTVRPAVASGIVRFESENVIPLESTDGQIFTNVAGQIGILLSRP